MNTTLTRCILLTLLIITLSSSLFAIELPLSFNWFSQNNVQYNKSQPNKELKWDEFYRIDIAVDSIKYHDLQLDLLLRSRAEFISSYLELNKIDIVYSLSKMSFWGTTREAGYGKQSHFNPHSLIHPNFDRYLYQDTRFNGVGVTIDNRSNQFHLRLGGNKQNQAIAQLNSKWSISPNFGAAIGFEARAMDSFRRTPVFIGSASMEYHSQLVELRTDIATSYFPKSGRTKEHANSYGQLCLAYKPFAKSSLYLEAVMLQPESVSITQKNFKLSYSYRLKDLCFSPGVEYAKWGNHDDSSIFILNELWLRPEQRIGIIYRLEDSETANYNHYFGVQAVLRYGL